LRLKILKKLKTASLNTEFTGFYKKKCSLAFGSVTLCLELEFIGVKRFLRFLENDKTGLRHFFQGLAENTCSLQPTLKKLHLAFKAGAGLEPSSFLTQLISYIFDAFFN